MKQYFVYVLKSSTDGKFYIGCSDDVERRIKEHNSGYTRSTKGRGPFVLLGQKGYDSRKEALEAEKWLKRQKDRKAIIRFLKTYS